MSNYKQRVERIERRLMPKQKQKICVIKYYDDGVYVNSSPYNDLTEDKPYANYEKLKHDLGVMDKDIVILLSQYGNYKQK
jgi:hypothetical protein